MLVVGDTALGGGVSLSPIETVQAINRCWESARVDDMRPHLAPQIYMAFPGFVGGSRGLDTFLDGFRDFVDNSTIESFSVAEVEEEIVSSTATVTYRFGLQYERCGTSLVGRGRDFWVLQRYEDGWIVTHRAMLDMSEEEAQD